MKAIGDNVIIKLDEPVRSIGSVIIPDELVEDVTRGTVISAGIRCSWVLYGDKIELPKNTGQEIHHEGNDYLVVKESSIIYIYPRD
jgi:chaperonin GroES